MLSESSVTLKLFVGIIFLRRFETGFLVPGNCAKPEVISKQQNNDINSRLINLAVFS
jgi:hypothetical protein